MCRGGCRRPIPGVSEAEERLTHLREHGPTEHAFTFKKRFAPPDAAEREAEALH